MKNTKKRIAITGLGLVTPLGIGKEHYWQNIKKGFPFKNNVHQIKKDVFPYPSGSLIEDFTIRHYLENVKLIKLLHPVNQFAFAAARLAIEDSGIGDAIDSHRKGLFFINSLEQINEKELERAVLACEEQGTFSYNLLGKKGMRLINPITPIKSLPNSALSIISIHFNFHGHNVVASPFESEAAMLLQEAIQSIRDNTSDYCLVGAADSPFCGSIAGDLITRALCRTSVEEDMCIHDLHLAEGAVFIALENEEKVRKEHRRIYGYQEDCCCAGTGATTEADALLQQSYREVISRQLNKRSIQIVIPSDNGLPLVEKVERDFWNRNNDPHIQIVSLKKMTGYYLSSSFLLDICNACLLSGDQAADQRGRINHKAVLVAGISLSLECLSTTIYK